MKLELAKIVPVGPRPPPPPADPQMDLAKLHDEGWYVHFQASNEEAIVNVSAYVGLVEGETVDEMVERARAIALAGLKSTG